MSFSGCQFRRSTRREMQRKPAGILGSKRNPVATSGGYRQKVACNHANLPGLEIQTRLTGDQQNPLGPGLVVPEI